MIMETVILRNGVVVGQILTYLIYRGLMDELSINGRTTINRSIDFNV